MTDFTTRPDYSQDLIELLTAQGGQAKLPDLMDEFQSLHPGAKRFDILAGISQLQYLRLIHTVTEDDMVTLVDQ